MNDWQDLVDLERLADWMDTQDLESGPIKAAVRLAGGTQNLLLRFRRGVREFVLRRPSLELREVGGKTIVREARLLKVLAGSQVPHAGLIADCTDQAVLGSSFYLMEPVQGFNPNSAAGLPAPHAERPALRRRMGFAMVDALLRLGDIDYQAVELADFGRPDGFHQRQVSRWLAHLDSVKDYPGWPGASSLPGLARLANWLSDHCPQQFEAGIQHGDFHLSNVMFRHDCGELAAVVDWELATIGDPLLDLAWLVVTWPCADGRGAGTIEVHPWDGFCSSDELVAHYHAGSSRSLADFTWYLVLAGFKLGIFLEVSYARACAGKASMVTGEKHHASALHLFATALQRIDQTA
ncbi:phosphotransferase family protein [Pseudomonas veronii]|uniref:Phosphotransferase family protein n=1 Tax=Pseudomonas veronii TaxID=76761 RepID=A0A7Y1F4U5_PSEVE|nr:phosphotransferase family protein [Pseudomonas veronii]KRP76143.1 aminoglycoside phosphotransferase [Pseudomonas veronii]NMX99278.1 phosphotransferase family protein [Pseudomonas veronii]OPK03740.1 phosphotransferase family protein [Pseudomonas veronii]SEC72630.1 Predicted kinase, aminoglycoside phosphotransferase (APT) family [Pseudomonas marginalis]